MQVPDWVFQQSPVELKQAFMTAKKRREMDSVLMTRAYREKLAGGKTQKGAYIYAVIRVRVPEGLLLQVSTANVTARCGSIYLLCVIVLRPAGPGKYVLHSSQYAHEQLHHLQGAAKQSHSKPLCSSWCVEFFHMCKHKCQASQWAQTPFYNSLVTSAIVPSMVVLFLYCSVFALLAAIAFQTCELLQTVLTG